MKECPAKQTRHNPVFFLLLGLIFLSGCARTVTVDTYASPGLTAREFSPGSKFRVMENPSIPNPIFDRSVKIKLEKLLEARGFSVLRSGNAADADYIMDYAYEMQGHEETYSYPRTGAGANFYYFTGHNRSIDLVPMFYTTYMVESYPVYTAKLRLRVLTPQSQKSLQERTLWVGEVWTQGIEPDMRKFMDYLAVAGVHMLGQDSQKPKNVKIDQNDVLLKLVQTEKAPATPAHAMAQNPDAVPAA